MAKKKNESGKTGWLRVLGIASWEFLAFLKYLIPAVILFAYFQHRVDQDVKVRVVHNYMNHIIFSYGVFLLLIDVSIKSFNVFGWRWEPDYVGLRQKIADLKRLLAEASKEKQELAQSAKKGRAYYRALLNVARRDRKEMKSALTVIGSQEIVIREATATRLNAETAWRNKVSVLEARLLQAESAGENTRASGTQVIEQLRTEISELQSALNDRAKESRERYRVLLKVARRERKEMNRAHRAIASLEIILRDERDSKSKEVEALQLEIARLTEELERVQETLVTKESVTLSLQGENDSLRAQLQQAQQEATEQNRSFEAQVSALTTKVQVSELQIPALKEDLARVRAELQASQELVTTLRVDLQRIQRDCAEVQGRLRSTSDTKRTVENELRQVQGRNADLVKDAKKSQKDHLDLLSQAESLRTQLAQAKEALEDIRRKVQQEKSESKTSSSSGPSERVIAQIPTKSSGASGCNECKFNRQVVSLLQSKIAREVATCTTSITVLSEAFQEDNSTLLFLKDGVREELSKVQESLTRLSEKS